MDCSSGIGFLWHKCPRLGQQKDKNVLVMQNTAGFTIFMPYLVIHGGVLGYLKILKL